MREFEFGRLKLRLLGSVVLAGLVSACSSDVARFSDDPFKSPFQSRTAFDPVSTNSINRSAGTTAARLKAAPVSSSITQPLPQASQPLLRTAAVAGPVAASSITTGSVASANYPALAAARNNPAVTGSTNGWSAVGGTPVTLGQGETVNTLSSRYGVPASAILAVNGLSGTNAAQPGQQLMIPAYNAVSGSPASGAARVAPQLAQAATPVPPRPAIRDVAPRAETDAEKRAAAKLRELKNKPAPVAADDDEDEAPAKLPPKPVTLAKAASDKKAAEAQKMKLIETKRVDEARKQLDEKKQADAKKAAEAKKIAEAQKIAEARKVAEAKKTADTRKAAEAKRVAALKSPPPAVADVETTASIPTAKPAPAKQAAAPVKPVEVETASEDTNSPAFRWPAQGRVISGFGARGTSGTNDGINIALPEGTPVRAAEGGTVVHADDALKGYGKLVLVRHPNGFVSVYAHNGEINVKRGESVKKGQVIAKSGQSGNVTSPQLHFEIRKGATPVDPNKFLASN